MKSKEQPACLRVVIPLSDSNIPLIATLHLGSALANEVKKMGGKARCFKATDFIIVELSGVFRKQIEPLIDSLGHSPSMNGAILKVVIEERTSPEIDLNAEGILPGEFAIERLTKKFLLGLPEGAIVVSTMAMDGLPAFMARLDGKEDRSRIWKRAVITQAAQGICSVYWNPADALAIHGIDPDTWDEVYDQRDDLTPLDPWSRM